MVCYRKRLFHVLPLAGIMVLLTYVACAAAQQKGKEQRVIPTQVQTMPDEGRWHLDPGEKWRYRSSPPTSGPHDPVPVRPGFYKEPQPPERLVHSLEHGTIVIYYDQSPAGVLAILKVWAERYQGKWDGVIVTPLPGLGEAVILTAWQKLLRLDPFDEQQATGFIEAFRGHGPEHGEHDDM
jgi:hypothetical protein